MFRLPNDTPDQLKIGLGFVIAIGFVFLGYALWQRSSPGDHDPMGIYSGLVFIGCGVGGWYFVFYYDDPRDRLK